MTPEARIANLQNEVDILKKKIIQLEQALDHINQMFLGLHEEVSRLYSKSQVLDDSMPGEQFN